MPNYIHNYLKIDASKDAFLTTVRQTCGFLADSKQPYFDFERLVEKLFPFFGNCLGDADERFCVAAGIPDWLAWNRENWGTKWGAMETEILVPEQVIYFTTAWTMPFPIVKAFIQKFPFIPFRWLGNCEYEDAATLITYKEGNVHLTHIDDNKAREAATIESVLNEFGDIKRRDSVENDGEGDDE